MADETSDRDTLGVTSRGAAESQVDAVDHDDADADAAFDAQFGSREGGSADDHDAFIRALSDPDGSFLPAAADTKGDVGVDAGERAGAGAGAPSADAADAATAKAGVGAGSTASGSGVARRRGQRDADQARARDGISPAERAAWDEFAPPESPTVRFDQHPIVRRAAVALLAFVVLVTLVNVLQGGGSGGRGGAAGESVGQGLLGDDGAFGSASSTIGPDDPGTGIPVGGGTGGGQGGDPDAPRFASIDEAVLAAVVDGQVLTEISTAGVSNALVIIDRTEAFTQSTVGGVAAGSPEANARYLAAIAPIKEQILQTGVPLVRDFDSLAILYLQFTTVDQVLQVANHPKVARVSRNTMTDLTG